MIRLSVPGTLKYRALVLRVVASSCKLLRSDAQRLQETSHGVPETEEFDAQVVSAIGEAFNNIAIHGYRGERGGEVNIEIKPISDGIEVCMMDYGVTFDLSLVAPTQPSNLPDQLPESGMGLYIIRSFMDSASYRPGHLPSQPNVLLLTKQFAAKSVGTAAAPSTPPSSEPTTDAQERTRAGK